MGRRVGTHSHTPAREREPEVLLSQPIARASMDEDGSEDDASADVNSFDEPMARLREQIQHAQVAMEVLDADIATESARLKAFHEEAESKSRLPPVYDPFAQIFQEAEEPASSLAAQAAAANKKLTPEQAARNASLVKSIVSKSTDSRLATRDRAIVRQVLLECLGGRYNHLPENTHDSGDTMAVAFQNTAVVKVRTGDRVIPELKFHAVPGYKFEDLHHDVCTFYNVPVDKFELSGRGDTKWPDGVVIVDEFRQLFQQGEALELDFVTKVKLPVGQMPTFQHPHPTYIEGTEPLDDTAEEASDSARATGPSAGQAAKAGTVPPTVVYVIRSLWSLLFYVTLMTTSMLLRRRIHSMYFVGRAVRSGLFDRKFGLYEERTLATVHTRKDVYEWMEGPLAAFVQPGPDGLIRHAFKQVGAVRVRQYRSSLNEGCELTPQLAVWERERQMQTDGSDLIMFVEGCHAPYFFQRQNKETFGNGGPGFTFMDSNNSAVERDLWTLGKFALYNPESHLLEFPPYTTEAAYAERVYDLRANEYLDASTRAVIVSINLYNGHYNYFVTAQVLFEFSLTGGIFPSNRMSVYSLEFIDKADTMGLAGEIVGLVVAFFALGSLSRSLYEANRLGWKVHFANPFNFAHWFMCVCWLVMTFLKIGMLASPAAQSLHGSKLRTQQSYVALSLYVEIIWVIHSLEAVAVVLSYFQVFRYYGLYPGPHALWLTLANSMPILGWFLFFFTFIFVGFCVFGHVMLGPVLVEFRSFMTTVSTMLQNTVGDLHAAPAIEASPVWGSIFFGTYAVAMNLILCNCGVAIVFYTYMAVVKQKETKDLEEAMTMKAPRYYPLNAVEFVKIVTGGLVDFGKEVDSIMKQGTSAKKRAALEKRIALAQKLALEMVSKKKKKKNSS